MTGRLNWLRVIKFIKTESRLVVSRAWGKNRVESVIRVSVLQNVKSSGCGWWWWSYNSINILSTVELFVVVQLLSHVWLFVTPWTAACQASCPLLFPGVCSNSCPLSWLCHLTISSSLAPYPFAFNLSHHQGLFRWVGSSHQVAKVLELLLHHQSFQWIFRVNFI